MRKKHVLREYIEAAVVAVLLALFIRTFVVQAFKIPSGSMVPTLLVGDHILVNKFIYGVKVPFVRKTLIPITDPQRGDVIVFIYPEDRSKDFIKRVIGLPGDRIEIQGHAVSINGAPYADEHAQYRLAADAGGNRTEVPRLTVTVPDNQLFVMGDNRDQSYDSRFWGTVPLQDVKGKAFIIYWSWPHWERFLGLIR